MQALLHLTRMQLTLRSTSRLVGVASLLLPAGYVVVQQNAFEAWAKTQEGGVCGMPLLAIWFMAFAASGLLSVVAVLLNYADLRRHRSGGAAMRFVELGVLALPTLAVVGVVALVVLAGF